MTDYDKEFVNTFNEYYPFERYIVKEPKRINYLFNDIVLTELFIPSTEIKPLIDSEGDFHGFTQVPDDEIYVKLKCDNSEFRMAYYDFADHIREEIRSIIYHDFGHYEWECLYVEQEDDNDLKKALSIQKQLTINKYGECNIKPDFIISDTIKLLSYD